MEKERLMCAWDLIKVKGKLNSQHQHWETQEKVKNDITKNLGKATGIGGHMQQQMLSCITRCSE
jgi:hypothetical protein